MKFIICPKRNLPKLFCKTDNDLMMFFHALNRTDNASNTNSPFYIVPSHEWKSQNGFTTDESTRCTDVLFSVNNIKSHLVIVSSCFIKNVGLFDLESDYSSEESVPQIVEVRPGRKIIFACLPIAKANNSLPDSIYGVFAFDNTSGNTNDFLTPDNLLQIVNAHTNEINMVIKSALNRINSK